MPTAVVATRGQVTIPKKIRDELGIKPATVLEFSVKNGAIVAVKKTEEDPVGSVIGCLKMKQSSDDFVRKIRGE